MYRDALQVTMELDVERGRESRDREINRASFHAENINEGWNEKALRFIQSYPLNKFMTEDVRLYAYQNGMEKPPSERAWGGVIKKAVKMGLLTCVGYQKVNNVKAHRTPAALWRKN
jgi:hypothetical protein